MSSFTTLSLMMMAISGTFGAGDIRGHRGGLQLFLRIPGQQGVQGIEVPADATAQDVINVAALPGDSILTFAERVLQTGEALADAGVSSECIIDVTTIPDIELLFHLFDDPADTELLFGNRTYAEFATRYPDLDEQKKYMLRSPYTPNYETPDYGIEFRGEFVVAITIKKTPVRSLNWNTLYQFQRLEELNFMKTQVAGSIDSHQLPRGLTEFDMFDNKLTGTIDFAGLPPGLKRLDLARNALTGSVNFAAVPPTMSQLLLGRNHLSINVTEIKNLDQSAERQVLGLYVAGNRLKGVMKRSEKPIKLRNHDLARTDHWNNDA